MASFTAFLDVKGNKFPLLSYELSIHQETDSLGRPASPTLGGTIDCVLSAPGSDKPFLTQWMFSPTMQQDGKIILLQQSPNATLKTISFFNAYCTGLQTSFTPGAGGGGSLQMHLRISPQRVAVGAIIHDNNWPLLTHGSGESFAKVTPPPPPAPPKKEEEPSAFMEGLHGVLDVVGMIPIIGEVADAANAAIYLGEGRYGEAALAAAAMIPLAGNVVGAAKLARTGAKLADKLGGVAQLASKGAKLADKAVDAVKGPLKKLRKACGDPVDVASGEVMAEAVDFSLSGPIPLVWERTWYSSSTYAGSLGHGWHHSYDWAIIAIAGDGTVGVRDGEGRLVAFEPPTAGGKGIQAERLALFLSAEGSYRLWHMDELRWYTFGPARAGQQYAQRLQSIEDPNGFAIRFAYDARQRLQTITDSAGRVLRVDTNEEGQILALHSPQLEDIPSFVLVQYAYDALGNLITVTDAEGHAMHCRYDGQQLVQRTARTGTNWHFTYESPQAGARCVHTWGDGGLLDYTLHYDSETQTTVLDSYQQPTTYTHANGVVTRQIDALGGEQRWTYSDAGQLLAYRDALGGVTRYDYDDQGRLLSVVVPDGSQTVNQYNERGLLATVVDARGSRWQWQHDERGNLQQRTDPLGATTTYDYDERGQLVTVTNALGQATHLRYDAQFNMAHMVTPDDQIRSRTYNELGQLMTITDPTGAVQRRQYDRLGQLTKVEEADGTLRQLTYDASGNVIEVRQNDTLVELSYTGLGQLSQRRQAGQQLEFEYDQEGRLTGLLNEAGLRYRFGLNSLGQVIEEEGFDGLLRRYERDAAGRVTKLIRPADRNTDYTYDEGGQVAQVHYSDGTQEVYGYDENGALIKAQNNEITVRLERDALGQVVRESQGDNWVGYTHDLLGQRTRIRSSLGADISMERDGMGNLSQLSSQSWQAQFGYDSRGLEVQRSLSGGVRSAWQRDASGRPAQQQISVGDATRQRTYHWQTGDLLGQIDDTVAGVSRYDYDSLGTLTRARYGDGTEELRLPDAVGNLFESAAQTDRQYGSGGQLLSSQSAAYEYDAEGNLSQKTTRQGEDGPTHRWQYVWAGNGMLTKVVRPDGAEVLFGYDALGRRVSKTYKGKTTHWVWEGNKPLHEWSQLGLDGQNTEEVITWLFEEDSFAPIGKLQGSTRQSILTDHLGTPLAMVDQAGQRTWQAQTTTYGRVRLSEGTRAECPFRFQGQYEDTETGLYYNRFRYYDPQAGQFITKDPIGLLGGPALYGYVGDPNTFIDPFGWYSDLNHDGMGHHLFPRSVAKKLGLDKLDKNGSIAWYPDDPADTADLHKKLHRSLIDEDVPFHGSKFTGTVDDFFDKAKTAYGSFNEKGFLKMPGTSGALFDNLTPGEALDKLQELYKAGSIPCPK